MRQDEIIIKKILEVLLEQSLKDKKDMTLNEFYKKIHKKDFDRVKHLVVDYTDRNVSLINMCVSGKWTDDENMIRINESNGIPYLERLEKKEKDEKRDGFIEEQTKFNKYVLLTASILALLGVHELTKNLIKSSDLKGVIISGLYTLITFVIPVLTIILLTVLFKEVIVPFFIKAFKSFKKP